MKTYIKGNYRRSIFESNNGYTIGLFKVTETNIENMEDYLNKTITFTGYFHDLNMEDSYIFYGEELEHPKYGFQFQVTEYERIKPEGKDGITLFLASDLFHGVGEKLAKKIVDTLGENTLERILNEENSLMLVPKMTSKKADTIKKTLQKYEESHQTIVYLNELGFNMRDSLAIYNTYKSNTITQIEHNIFRLLDDLADISFPKLDEISKKLKYEENDERRIGAAIVYLLKQESFKTGDTYFTEEEIYQSLHKNLYIEIDNITYEEILKQLIDQEKIVIEDKKLYLKDLYDAEQNIANRMVRLINTPKRKYKALDESLTTLEEVYGIQYNKKQKEAIKTALLQNVTIITGGPGTGKTTIIKAIVELYQKLNHLKAEELEEEMVLLAPTGRASKRMSEGALFKASTIHRFLKWNKDNNEFAINEWNPDSHHFIIIDEVSMIDTVLLDHLLKGLITDIQLVFVGDYNQLPSVGAGQILKDMIDSDMIPTIKLEELYRQDENSFISTLAGKVKEGEIDECIFEKYSDFTFLNCQGQSIRHNLKELCITLKEKGYDEKRVQIMAPMYRGENGIDNLNKELQEVFNPASALKEEIKYGDVIFREQDKVLQLVNRPEDNVFNGDIGVIERIVSASRSKSHKTEIYVNYDGNSVKYLPKDFVTIKHGFAITIHKSQGSEFEAVIMPISRSYYRMLYRKLVYTGITRAKKKLILLGEANAFYQAVKNNHEYLRRTSLKDKILMLANN